MISTQDSIENCSICQNSRNKNFFMAPEYYNQIFGYMGPVSKYNLIDLLNSKENISSKEIHNKDVKKSTSKLSKIYDSRNDLKKDRSTKWLQPGRFLYNFKSQEIDKTKMRYDESDTDFDDLRNKNKQGKLCQSDCTSNDSISQIKNKKKLHRTDSEDIYPLKFHRKSSYQKIEASMKNKVSDVDSNFLVNSTNKINRKQTINRNTSSSSIKINNLKSVDDKLFGSIEFIKHSKHRKKHVSKAIDPEDMEAKIVNCTKTKKPATAFTNSQKKNKRGVTKNTSLSSTDLTNIEKLQHGTFNFIDSTKYLKKGKKKPNTYDAEDELYVNCRNPWLRPRKKCSREKTNIPIKKTKDIVSKCYICNDLPKSHKHY